MLSIIQVLLVAPLLAGTILGQDTVVVNTTFGALQGDVLTIHNGQQINTFLGVPFAKPPVGSLRWASPQDPDSWPGILQADTYGSACPQVPSVILLTQPRWRDYDEDCLYLNVYAPTDQSGGPYPVMVFMHGGAFTTGAASQYTGHFLAAKGVVVVMPNYRLHVLGFGTTADEACPGNFGMLDQVHALRWVQNNIGGFGGDRQQVTIFGESAGGVSVGFLIVSPLSQDLFHAAILQSGSELANWAVTRPNQQPEDIMRNVADQLGCTNSDSFLMVECLRGIPQEDIRAATRNCTEEDFNCTDTGPTVDGTFLPAMPTVIRQSRNFANVPTIMGINREDGNLFVSGIISGPVSKEEFQSHTRYLVDSYVASGIPIAPDREEDVYQALLWHYSPWPHLDDTSANSLAIGNRETDYSFGYPMDASIKFQAEYVTTFEYIFALMPSDAPNIPDYIGVTHMAELPYVFGFPMLQLNDNVRNQTGIIDLFNYTEIDIAYSDLMMTLWTNFAKYHNPTPEPVDIPLIPSGPVTWGTFSKERLNYIYISNDVVETRENYRQSEYSFWQSYLNWIINGEEWPFP